MPSELDFRVLAAVMSTSEETTETLPDPYVPLRPEQVAKLETMSMKGRTITFKYKGKLGRRKIGVVEDEVYIMVGDYKHLIQKVRFEDGVSHDGSLFAYRSGYYTYEAGRKHIKWGQYTQFLTEKEYRALLQKTQDKGWDIM